jgi:hypothetical protein
MSRVSAGARLQTGAWKWQPCAPLLARSGGLLIECYEQTVTKFIAGNGVMLARRTHVLAAPKWSTVMPKPHLSYPRVGHRPRQGKADLDFHRRTRGDVDRPSARWLFPESSLRGRHGH